MASSARASLVQLQNSHLALLVINFLFWQVMRQQAKDVPLGSERAGPVVEEKIKESPSGPATEPERQEDRRMQEESPGSVCEQEEPWLQGAKKTGGPEHVGSAGQRKSRKRGGGRAEQDMDGEGGLEKGNPRGDLTKRIKEEEVAEGGQEVGEPFLIQVECDSGERKRARRKKSKAKEAPEGGDDCPGRKGKRSRTKGASPKAEAAGASRKRKAKDDGGCKRKKPKKEERGEAEASKWKW